MLPTPMQIWYAQNVGTLKKYLYLVETPFHFIILTHHLNQPGAEGAWWYPGEVPLQVETIVDAAKPRGVAFAHF